MGDNLKAASRFVSQSIASLDHLMTTDTLNHVSAIDQLADLQSRAKAMRARSIYRAAQTAVDMIHNGDEPQRVQSEFHTIRSLVEQYKSGLDEVLQELSPMAESQMVQPMTDGEMITPVNEVATPSPVGDMIDSLNMQLQVNMSEPQLEDMTRVSDDLVAEAPVTPTIEASVSENLSRAASILEPLIQYAPLEQQRDALHDLSRFEASFASTGMVNGQVKKAQSKIVEFEALMPELTNVVLSRARHAGKTVSISYAANSVRIGQGVADTLRPALVELISILVRRSLETPEIRRERGESGAGHISIIASLVQGKINMQVECTGRDLDDSDLDVVSWTKLKPLGAQVTLGRETDRFKLSIKDLPVYVQGQRRKSLGSFEMEQAS